MALTTYPAAARDVTSLVRLGGDAKVALARGRHEFLKAFRELGRGLLHHDKHIASASSALPACYGCACACACAALALGGSPRCVFVDSRILARILAFASELAPSSYYPRAHSSPLSEALTPSLCTRGKKNKFYKGFCA